MTGSTFATPEQLITFATGGRVSKHALASLLTPQARRPFLDACAAIELTYTESCRALNDPCLESGCSAEGERCLEPLLRAGNDYNLACGLAWAKLFAYAVNRDPSWAITVAAYELA